MTTTMTTFKTLIAAAFLDTFKFRSCLVKLGQLLAELLYQTGST